MTSTEPTFTRTPRERVTSNVAPVTDPALAHKETGIRSARLGEEGRIGDLADGRRLLCFRPLAIEVIETSMGPSEATITQVVEVADDRGGFIDQGEHPVFWTFVRQQLAEQCDDEFPWLVGRLSKGQRAYRILPATPADVAACDRALGMFSIAEAAAAEVGESTGDDEPF